MRSGRILASNEFKNHTLRCSVDSRRQQRSLFSLVSLVFCSAFGLTSLFFSGCHAGGVRPTFSLFPQAIIDSIPGEPESAVEHLSELLADEGIELRWKRIREGYVETEWFDPETRAIGGGGGLDVEGIIRIRFWADLVMGGELTQVVFEVVRRRIFDPSLPVRETEIGVALDHPIYELVERLLTELASG